MSPQDKSHNQNSFTPVPITKVTKPQYLFNSRSVFQCQKTNHPPTCQDMFWYLFIFHRHSPQEPASIACVCDYEYEQGSSSNSILMYCKPHRVASGQSNSGHKQIQRMVPVGAGQWPSCTQQACLFMHGHGRAAFPFLLLILLSVIPAIPGHRCRIFQGIKDPPF